ncbi:Avirulence (Avh) protein [Phytophthora megakarya]|uniref:Avirulence (Avh) protein n=1 Tax=Phytophthora megakarya TaxID=4795 RepID=A0A225V6N2_9STRA|nr:Avirulence (Avh) protein [Phytophthora megakarya]
MDPPTLKLATKLEMDQMQHWLTTRKDPDEVFQLLQLNMAGSNIFEKAAFPTWVKYVDDLNSKYPEDPTWMYTTLAKYVNDNVLFQMTYVAKKSENTKAIATKVEDEWFQSGLQNRKTPAKALLNLELGTTADSGLESSLLSTWARYTEVFGRRYPEEKSTMIETLTKNFDDFDVTKILHIAKTEELTNPLATKLEAAQLKLWLNSGKSTDDIFKLLKLDQDINDYSFQDKILLSTWVSYLDLFITKHPDKKDVLFSALEFRLNDRPFNEIISMAKKFSSLESTAIRIQNSQFPSFLASNKSPRNVFTLLRLADEGDDILGTPVFQMWMKYVEDFNKRNPARKESWFNPIRIECEWGGIRMIDKAMQNPSTVDIGKKLEREWLNYWLDEGNTPEVVFRWLNLVKAGGRALADRKFKTWTSYLDEFSKKYPTEAITVIDGLRANYNDINLLGVFKEAKNNPTTEKLTINLENTLIDKWVAEKKSVEFLQKQLGHVDTSKDMIQRFTAKLEKIRNHTS